MQEGNNDVPQTQPGAQRPQTSVQPGQTIQPTPVQAPAQNPVQVTPAPVQTAAQAPAQPPTTPMQPPAQAPVPLPQPTQTTQPTPIQPTPQIAQTAYGAFASAGQEPDGLEVAWSASEFISHEKTGIWYLTLGVGAAILTIIVFLVTRNVFSSLVIAFVCILMGVYGARKPQTKKYLLNEDGVHVDTTFFPYENFKSFSVLEDGAVECIWLRPIKRYMPTVAMYYSPEDEERIVMMLENFLPLEDREHDFMDRLSRFIRF